MSARVSGGRRPAATHRAAPGVTRQHGSPLAAPSPGPPPAQTEAPPASPGVRSEANRSGVAPAAVPDRSRLDCARQPRRRHDSGIPDMGRMPVRLAGRRPGVVVRAGSAAPSRRRRSSVIHVSAATRRERSDLGPRPGAMSTETCEQNARGSLGDLDSGCLARIAHPDAGRGDRPQLNRYRPPASLPRPSPLGASRASEARHGDVVRVCDRGARGDGHRAACRDRRALRLGQREVVRVICCTLNSVCLCPSSGEVRRRHREGVAVVSRDARVVCAVRRTARATASAGPSRGRSRRGAAPLQEAAEGSATEPNRHETNEALPRDGVHEYSANPQRSPWLHSLFCPREEEPPPPAAGGRGRGEPGRFRTSRLAVLEFATRSAAMAWKRH